MTDAIEDKIKPVRNSSVLEDCLLSSMEGIIDMVATVGIETHDGGPNDSEYPVKTCIGLPSTSLLLVLFLTMGESSRLENVSGTTCFFPGICLTRKRNIRDFNLKFIIPLLKKEFEL